MKTRVLVADDDQLVADTLSLIFNANGYECEARYSAESAFEYVHSFAPALLLYDLNLEEQDAVSWLRRVHVQYPQTRLLLLTASPFHRPEVLRLQTSLKTPPKLLLKPCRPDDLLRETQALLA